MSSIFVIFVGVLVFTLSNIHISGDHEISGGTTISILIGLPTVAGGFYGMSHRFGKDWRYFNVIILTLTNSWLSIVYFVEE